MDSVIGLNEPSQHLRTFKGEGYIEMNDFQSMPFSSSSVPVFVIPLALKERSILAVCSKPNHRVHKYSEDRLSADLCSEDCVSCR